MKKSWKTKWLAALRSGEYKQTQRTLRRTEAGTGAHSYCCLGVLCDITKDVSFVPVKNPGSDVERAVTVDGEHWGVGSLEPVAHKRYGLTEAEETKLIELNDEKGKGFKAIANYIEKKL